MKAREEMKLNRFKIIYFEVEKKMCLVYLGGNCYYI